MRTFWSLIVFLVAAFLLTPAFAKEPDWGKIRPYQMTMIYPGVASWEFLRSDDHRLGGRDIAQMRKGCKNCHYDEGEIDLKADEIASGSLRMKRSLKSFEPDPVAGAKGTLKAELKAAYDSEFIYVRVEWPSIGASWQKKSDSPDRVSIQLNGADPAFARYGCFISCHNDAYTMPNSPSNKDVRANEYYASLKRDDVRLYAYYAKGAWNAPKSPEELGKLLSARRVVDLWTIEMENNGVSAQDSWILEDRRSDDKQDVSAVGKWANERYWAVFKRKLRTNDATDVQLKDNDAVNVSLAIHDRNSQRRHHYVSFPYALGLGSKGDISATKVPD